jgi:hypothetical protein
MAPAAATAAASAAPAAAAPAGVTNHSFEVILGQKGETEPFDCVRRRLTDFSVVPAAGGYDFDYVWAQWPITACEKYVTCQVVYHCCPFGYCSPPSFGSSQLFFYVTVLNKEQYIWGNEGSNGLVLRTDRSTWFELTGR